VTDVDEGRRENRCSDPRLELLVSLLGVVRESLAELVMINAQMEKEPGKGPKKRHLDSVLLKLYTMLIQLQSARCAIESESKAKARVARKASSARRSLHARPRRQNAMSYREYLEMSSLREHRKFKRMGPVTDADLKGCNADEILRKLTG
jgi:hypothetical protein